MSSKQTTYLDLVDLVDSFPYDAGAEKLYYTFALPESVGCSGWIHQDIVKQMPWTDDFHVDTDSKEVRLLPQHAGPDITSAVNAALQKLIDLAIKQNTFRCIGGRHSELFLVPGTSYPAVIERFATSLFGIPTRGAHMTVYCRNKQGQMMIWVPRRSEHVGTWRNMLDTTVAGGVAAHESPFENIVREAAEEASLTEELVRKHTVPAGVLTYMGVSKGENGWEEGMALPDVVCIYDLEVGQDVVPRPCDDEVKEFHLMSVDEVKTRLLAKEFKPNSAVIMLDFFIRHGIITYENERDFVEIVQRMHRRLPFAIMAGSAQ